MFGFAPFASSPLASIPANNVDFVAAQIVTIQMAVDMSDVLRKHRIKYEGFARENKPNKRDFSRMD